MGLLKAAAGAVGGTLADQWLDFLSVPPNVSQTAALFPAVRVGRSAGRGSNTLGSSAVVSNGSRIVVPEGYGLLTFQEGGLTAFAFEPGGYIWNSEDVSSQAIFAGDNWSSALVRQSWERFKFGGRPNAQQVALFVNLKELPNNRFGTQSVIYWDDAYFNAQVGAVTYGTYSLSIVDPITFVKQFVPASYLQNGRHFDFTDATNAAANQLFSEVVGSLSAAFSAYVNDAGRGRRIANIQRDSAGITQSLAQVVEDAYHWKYTRGLAISKVAILGIEYDEASQELLRSIQRADALAGSRGSANLQASIAAGMEAAGSGEGAGGLLAMGLAAGSLGLPSGPGAPQEQGPAPLPQAHTPDLVTTLEGLKRALDAGLITEADFDAAKAKALGL